MDATAMGTENERTDGRQCNNSEGGNAQGGVYGYLSAST